MSIDLLSLEHYVRINYTQYYDYCSPFAKDLLVTYRYLFLSLYMIVKPLSNIIPFYYQAMLFCLIIFTFRLFKDKTFYKNSSITWMFMVYKTFAINYKNYKIFFSYWFNKFIFFITFISFKIFHYCRYFLSVWIDVFKKYKPFVLWRPVFKKTSYFGIFSSMRSKWFKNKK